MFGNGKGYPLNPNFANSKRKEFKSPGNLLVLGGVFAVLADRHGTP